MNSSTNSCRRSDALRACNDPEPTGSNRLDAPPRRPGPGFPQIVPYRSPHLARPDPMLCPECSATLRFKGDLAGKKVRCPKCKQVFRLPEDDSVVFDSLDTVDSGGDDDRTSENEAGFPDIASDSADYAPDRQVTTRRTRTKSRPVEGRSVQAGFDLAGFTGGLFGFEQFWAVSVARILMVVCYIASLFFHGYMLYATIRLFSIPELEPDWKLLLFWPVSFVVSVLFIRLIAELFVVPFRIYESVNRLHDD